MPKRNTQKGTAARTVRMTVIVDASKLDRFRAVAEADHRTVSQELRRLMEQHIAEADSLEQAA